MNKKYSSYITVAVLCLNLFNQTSNAFMLNDTETGLIYTYEGEKEKWEEWYLPHAKYLKLINETETVLDVAKIAYRQRQTNQKNKTIVWEIMECTPKVRAKMLVKWERDNGYIIPEKEKDLEITPLRRREILREIKEEEERENEIANQISWKKWKTGAKVGGAVAGFVVSMFIKKDIWTIAALITTTVTLAATAIDIWEVKEVNKGAEEIKLPPLRNMPTIPAGHKRVDVYNYGL
jgi:hypothetical protein